MPLDVNQDESAELQPQKLVSPINLSINPLPTPKTKIVKPPESKFTLFNATYHNNRRVYIPTLIPEKEKDKEGDSDSDSDLDRYNSDNENEIDVYFGDQGKKLFYDIFKVGNTAKDLLGTTRELSGRTSYIKECFKRHLVPDPIIIRKRPSSSMEFQYFSLGNTYIKSLGSSLSMIPHVNTIDLRGNGLVGNSIEVLMNGLINTINNVLEIDLSNNPIGRIGIKYVADYISDPNCKLYSLRIENCDLGRGGAIILAPAIGKNRSISHLNISRNRIEGDGAAAIGVGISANPFLETLEMNFNEIRGLGAASLARSLQINDSLKVLDLSYNGLSSSPENIAMTCLMSSLAVNRTLVHLVLTRNNLRATDIETISKGLKYNYYLKGIHIVGNDGHLDPKGYLHPGQLVMEAGLNPNFIINENHCWVCNNFQEHLFTYSPLLSGNIEKKNIRKILLKLEIDEYRGDEMTYNPTENRYQLYRMVPPGICHFYFSINDEINTTADDQWTENIKEGQSAPVDSVNACVIKVDDDIELARCTIAMPRITKSLEVDLLGGGSGGNGVSASNTRWSLKQSYFYPRARENDSRNLVDTPEVLLKALASDWNDIHFGRLIKDERKLEKLQEQWGVHYADLRAIWQHYCCQTSGDDYFRINLEDFEDILHDGGVYHPKLLNQNKIESIWVESYKEFPEIEDPKSCVITRGKFMELLTRISMVRFGSKKKPIRPTDAVDKLMLEFFIPNIEKTDPNSFRKMYLYNQEMDETVRIYLPIFKGIFDELAKVKIVKFPKPFITLDLFMDMVKFSKLISGPLTELQARECFQQSKAVVVDQKTTKRYQVLSLFEFIEAVVRLSLYYVVPPKDIPPILPPIPQSVILSVMLQNLALEIRNMSESMRRSLCIVQPPPVRVNRVLKKKEWVRRQ